MRATVKSADLREHVTWMHELHRGAQMGERQAYSDNIFRASTNPSRYMSSIQDGMDGTYSTFPYFGNLAQWKHVIKLNVQAFISHKRSIKLYIVPPNVRKGANLATHIALLELLAYVKNNNGQFPEVWMHQMDGGPENANETFLGHFLYKVLCI